VKRKDEGGGKTFLVHPGCTGLKELQELVERKEGKKKGSKDYNEVLKISKERGKRDPSEKARALLQKKDIRPHLY